MPAPLDCVLTVMLVAVLRSATRAPGTLAPDVSVTVPVMVPCSPCANSGADAINRASERPTWFRILIRLSLELPVLYKICGKSQGGVNWWWLWQNRPVVLQLLGFLSLST